LLGKFVSYDAKVVHANSFGNPELSLVKGVKLHELTRSIREYGANDDKINDFLVNDIFDLHNDPDVIYFSQGKRTSKVYPAASGSFSAPVTGPSFTNKLTVTASDTGWNYIKLNDPGNKLYELASVTRNDGQKIPLDNAWLTFVTLPVSQAPVYENKFHFVDTFSSVEPVSYTVVWKPKNLNVPKVDSITGVPKQVTATQVENVKVHFNKTIDPATFTYEDLNLTFQGGQNIINNSVVITQIDTATFNIDLSKLTIGNGFYALTVQAANVADVYGINGVAGKQATWTQFLTVPTVQEFRAIPASKVASSYDTIQVLFNLAIDEASVTPARFKIMKNGIVQQGMVTIDSVRADHKLFYLSGLKNILTQSGDYSFVVDLPNIKSINQIPGTQEQSITLTVDNEGPTVLSLEKSNIGGIDPQHIPFVNIKFNEDVVGFNTSYIQLTRNGEVIPLRIDQLSNTDMKTWIAGNFGMLTYPDGNYTLTLNLQGLKDAVGNSGSGSQQVSWTVDHSAIVGITSLGITPDGGYSNNDGITSEQSVSVTFSMDKNASQVTVSQVDGGGESVLAIVQNVPAGKVSIPVSLVAGGNTGIRVTAIGEDGGAGIAEKKLYVDQIPLSAQWAIEKNISIARQVDTLSMAVSAKLLSEDGFLNAITLKRNGVTVSTSALNFKAINDTLYQVSGLRTASILPGNYELSFNTKSFSKYSSGAKGDAIATATWTVLSTNRAPVAKAGEDLIITKAGEVTLNASASVDPDADAITYTWVAPAGITLNDSTSAKPKFTVTSLNQGNTYPFLLIVSDGKLFTTDVVNVVVNLATDQEYYRSMITGNWNDPSTWQSSTDSITWKAATVSPSNSSKTIAIQSGHTVTVTQNVTIDETVVEPGGVLSVALGNTVTVINNGLTLRSNSTGSGSIGESAGTITGNVTVERFIPARRAWRLLSVPFASAQNIRAAWQEGGINTPGYGTQITGGTIANGFDQSPFNSSSIKTYNQSLNIWNSVASTLASITDQQGYMVFVRGDRTIDLSQGANAAANNTVLRVTGTLKTGTQPAVTVPSKGFTLVANPYASSIDFTKITKTNIPSRFYVWDPKRASVGAYVLFDAADGYEPLTSGGSYTSANTMIESGQAFFVEGSGSTGSIVVAENSKTAMQRNAFRTGAVNDSKLQVNLNVVNADNTVTLVDAAVTRYNDDYTKAVTSEDAGKLDNIDENIAVVRDGKLLTVERRPVISNTDTMFLRIYNMKAKSYQFEISPTGIDRTVTAAYLEDAWLNTKTAVNLKETTKVQFNITSDVASADPNRFRIVFEAAGALPVNFTTVKAAQKNDGVQVEWKVATETNVHHYEVERSTDGNNFTKVGSVAATSNNNTGASYNWFDAKPNDNNFYRIKAVENSGDIKYSEVVNVKISMARSSIVMYPNPVKDQTLYIKLDNQPKGKYVVRLFNNSGQQVFIKTIEHDGGSVTVPLDLRSVVSKGMFQVLISNGENRTTQQIIIN